MDLKVINNLSHILVNLALFVLENYWLNGRSTLPNVLQMVMAREHIHNIVQHAATVPDTMHVFVDALWLEKILYMGFYL